MDREMAKEKERAKARIQCEAGWLECDMQQQQQLEVQQRKQKIQQKNGHVYFQKLWEQQKEKQQQDQQE